MGKMSSLASFPSPYGKEYLYSFARKRRRPGKPTIVEKAGLFSTQSKMFIWNQCIHKKKTYSHSKVERMLFPSLLFGSRLMLLHQPRGKVKQRPEATSLYVGYENDVYVYRLLFITFRGLQAMQLLLQMPYISSLFLAGN